MHTTDTEILRRAKPYLRSAAAFVIFLARGVHIEWCYRSADTFINILMDDVLEAAGAPPRKEKQ